MRQNSAMPTVSSVHCGMIFEVTVRLKPNSSVKLLVSIPEGTRLGPEVGVIDSTGQGEYELRGGHVIPSVAEMTLHLVVETSSLDFQLLDEAQD